MEILNNLNLKSKKMFNEILKYSKIKIQENLKMKIQKNLK